MSTKTTIKRGPQEPTGKVRHVMIEPAADGGYSVSTHREAANEHEMSYHNPKPHVFTHHAPMLKHVKRELGCGTSAEPEGAE